MLRTIFLSALLLAAPALAQEAAPSPPSPPPAPEKVWQTVSVRIETDLGPIIVALEKERAPLTTANFLKYADQKRYDGTSFYRAMNFPARPDLGLVQGGIKSDPKRALPPVAHEPTTKTGLTHGDGAISMARSAPGTANGDFFIIVGGLPGLDADPKAGGDNQGFAVFGKVTEGMDVVKKILAAPVSTTEGAGVMKGQIIEKPVLIRSIRRVP